MRDLLLISIVVIGALLALRKPWLGVLLWTWVSLMNPHSTFGYAAAEWPVGLIVAVSTIVGTLLTRDKQNPFQGAPVSWLMAFFIWICITLPFSFYFESSFPLWVRSAKIFLMLFVSLSLLNEKRKLDYFIWVVVISIGFFGLKGGIFTILTGGQYRVWGPGGFIEGNNELALALVMTIPLMRYLHLQLHVAWQRRIMELFMALTALTVLGSYSRGALLAIAAMALFLWLKGRNKITFGILILAVALAALPFMPDGWWDRMRSIQDYQNDPSALGRINAWWNAWNLANSKVFGGGFMIYVPEVFAMYSPEPERVHAAHSIYFQVLGEHGWIGLLLFLGIGASTWVACRKMASIKPSDLQARWSSDLAAMIQVSMIGFAVGGAFLSLAYFDLPYNAMVIAVLAMKISERSSLSGDQNVVSSTEK